MEKIRIKLTHLAAMLRRQNPANLPELFRDAFSNWAEPKTIERELAAYFPSPNWGILNLAGRGIYLFGSTSSSFEIFYKPDQPIDCLSIFQPIKDFADWVDRSYDNDCYPWEQSAWDLGYCTGDDDVDYNASYLYLIIAILELYLLQNKLTYKEFTCNYHS